MIVVSIREQGDGTQSIQKVSAEDTDLVEIRADEMTFADIQNSCEASTVPCIVTIRHLTEGGRFAGTREDQRLLYKRVIEEVGPAYVDISEEMYNSLPRSPGESVQRIISYHDFDSYPKDLEQVVRRMCMTDAEMIKIAVRPRAVSDLMKLLSIKSYCSKPLTVLAIGEEWSCLRILYKRVGSILTYCCVDSGEETAEGQVSVAMMRDLYRGHLVDADTKVFGILGYPVKQSLSPLFFNRLFRDRAINACYVPMGFPDVSQFKEFCDALDITGLSVTAPYKRTVKELVDTSSDICAQAGSVNTVVMRDGRWHGENTDAQAALTVLKTMVMKRFGTDLHRKRVLVLGYGGAARALASAIQPYQMDIFVSGRHAQEGKLFADQYNGTWISPDACDRLEVDIVVNATSGEDPDCSCSFTSQMIAFDMHYEPTESRFLRRAREAGSMTVNGLDMFLEQARAQARYVAEIEVDINVVRECLQWR